ncbi:MAG TPA: hypothetical protein VKT78_12495, partial [Fimbriimonadaceae bacterium]|nr:hypothetical protein [Fimbriimonadaceae bacterium]
AYSARRLLMRLQEIYRERGEPEPEALAVAVLEKMTHTSSAADRNALRARTQQLADDRSQPLAKARQDLGGLPWTQAAEAMVGHLLIL